MLIEIGLNPVLLRAGPVVLGWHGVLTALAVMVATRLGTLRAERQGVPSERLGGVLGWGLAGGLVGARLFHVLDHLPQYAADPLSVLAVWEGGIAVYGAFVGGLVAGVVVAWREGLPIWRLLDAVAPALLVGQALGRVGCLINGDAWGGPTGGSWGVVYLHPGALLPSNLLGVATHPYPLYEAAAATLVLGGLRLAHGRLRVPGTTFLLVVLAYAAMRFGLSSVRQEAAVFLGLQEAQVVALATALLALGGLRLPRRDLPGPTPMPVAGGA